MGKKYGIVTTCHAINYGAVLQAYALKECVKEITNGDVYIINYPGNLQIMGREMYRPLCGIKSIIYNLKVFFDIKYKAERKNLIYKFDVFKKNCLEIDSELLKTQKELNERVDCDVLISGSDQIWNLNLMNDKVFFLDFQTSMSSVKRYSYAASIAEKMNNEQKKLIKKRVQNFNGISVREKKTSKELEKYLGQKVFNHIDPVFLRTEREWRHFSNCKNVAKERYILVFMIGRYKSDQYIVDAVKKHYGLPTKQIKMHPVSWIKTDSAFEILAPEEFVKAIFEADIIVTDSFHAVSFSIIAQKNFYTIKRSTRNSRIENLFNILAISNRYLDINHLDKMNNMEQINYDMVKKNIRKEQMKSYDYIRSMTEG